MCVIIALGKGQEIPYVKLKNAALNNPEGFGLVYTNGSELHVYHKFDEKGNDPELVAKKLEQFSDAEMRYLHLRYRTKGSASKENTHPFTVFNKDGHRIEFMHNGSLHKYQSASETVKSDTKQWADNFLAPLLSKFKGENGFGDLDDLMLDQLIEDNFNYTNRGLLISSLSGPHYYGNWYKIKDTKGVDIAVSNDDYFDFAKEFRMTTFYKPKASDLPAIIKNGYSTNVNVNHEKSASSSAPFGTATVLPVAQERVPNMTNTADTTEKSTTKKDEQSQTKTGVNSTEKSTGTSDTSPRKKFLDRDLVAIKEVNLSQTGRFLEGQDLAGLLDADGGPMDDELISEGAYLSQLEFKEYVNMNPEGASFLIEHLFMRCEDLITENEKLLEKKFNAEHTIILLKKELGAIAD